MKKLLLLLIAFAFPLSAMAGNVPLGRTTANTYPYEYTLYPSDSIILGNTANPQFNGFGSGYARIQTATSSNDIEQWQLINRSNGAFSAGCVFLVNDKATLDTIGAASNYYGGMCLAGSNYNIPGFNGLKPNGIGVFATDGPLTLGSGSSNAASSSIYFQAGSGLDASYDATLQGGTGNLGVASSSPGTRLGVMGDGVFAGIVDASRFVATSTLSSIFPYASTTGMTSSQSSFFATASGAVGVGTTSIPTAGSVKLLVASVGDTPLRIITTGCNHSSGLEFGQRALTVDVVPWLIGQGSDCTNNEKRLFFSGASNVTLTKANLLSLAIMTMDSSNKTVAIGTTTTASTQKLVISGTGQQITLTDTTGTSAPWNFKTVGGNFFMSTSTALTNATTTSSALQMNGTGSPSVSIATTTAVGILNLGNNPGSTASSTITFNKALQFNSIEGGTTPHCTYINSSGALITEAKICP